MADNTKLLLLTEVAEEFLWIVERDVTGHKASELRSKYIAALGIGHVFERDSNKFVVTKDGFEQYE